MKIDNGYFIQNKTIENAAMEEITMAENFLCVRGAQAKMCMCPPGVSSALALLCSIPAPGFILMLVSDC